MKIKGAFEAGVGGSATITNCGPGLIYEGGSDTPFGGLLASGPLRSDDEGLFGKLDAVRQEVASVIDR